MSAADTGLFTAPPDPHLVTDGPSFRIADQPTSPPDDYDLRKKQAKLALAEMVDRIGDRQRVLYADNRWSLLVVFQAMDAAGKDGTIRHVMSGINPAGCQVFSFKQPTSNELEHDYLWRTTRCLPERGRIGVFNRSHYEEVLVVRVHPEYLGAQRLPVTPHPDRLWAERFESIVDYEQHLARNGTAIVKFWLNISRKEQRRRFLARLDEPHKNWKFSVHDVTERGHWDEYMHAYEQAIGATTRPWAPWYAIPADDKRYMRLAVARILLETLYSLDLNYPEVEGDVRRRFAEMRALLEDER